MLILNFEKASEYIDNVRWADIEDKNAIMELFSKKFEDGSIPNELSPKDWSRFCDNIYKLFQAFQGYRPTGISNRNLSKLKDFLKKIDDEICRLGHDKIPRSITLFQFVVGIIGSSYSTTEKRKEYFIPITDEIRLFYPDFEAPGEPFQLHSIPTQ